MAAQGKIGIRRFKVWRDYSTSAPSGHQAIIARWDGESRRSARTPAITADEKRQLIDTNYGAMITLANADDDGFVAIDAVLGNYLLQNGSDASFIREF